MKMHASRRSIWSLALILLLAGLGCESSNVVAPEGSTISLSATPATIILDTSGNQIGSISILATLTNGLGVFLPGQDIFFTTTSGVLNPPGGTSVRTDSSGTAVTSLSGARQAATITATSGSTSGTLQLTTATCDLSNLALNVSTIAPNFCSDLIAIEATATDGTGAPCAGILVSFSQEATATPSTDVTMQFNPGSTTTNSVGVAATTLSFAINDCDSKCANGKSCTGQFIASAGGVESSPVKLVDTIP